MQHISKAQVKLVRSLHRKAVRDEMGLFVAEGDKCVVEMRKAFRPYLIITPDNATRTEIEQMSSLRTPQGTIGVFYQERLIAPDQADDSLIVALDGVQDPGNLGTIIRTCDWFGVRHIVCSRDTADCFGEKVVQATMGALTRVRVEYVDLVEWIREERSDRPEARGEMQVARVVGTLLEGRDMYEVLGEARGERQEARGRECEKTIVIMGNEGNGISEEVRRLITHPIRIPSYPKDAATSESLNVAIATAIVLAELRRMS